MSISSLCRFFLTAAAAAALQVFAAPQYLDHTVSPQRSGANPEQIAEMDALLQSFVDEKKLGAVVGFVAKGGNVVYSRAFGWRDIENRVPARVDDYYVLMSQTKAITTVAFMTLVEEGRVAIDDPVSKYFPEIPNQVVTAVREDGTYETRPVAAPMTFVHLMSHTSGLNAGLVRDIRRAQRKGNEAPAGFGGVIPERTPSGQHTGGGNLNSQYLEEEMLALVQYPLGFDPGSRWEYHTSSNMLGYLIERISGKPLREFVKERVLTPLGMDDTDWFYEPYALKRFIKAYRSVNGQLEPATNLYSEGTVSAQQTYCEGAIGLNGPIEDYAKFCQMLLNQGEFNGRRILRPETVKLMTTINRLPENSGAEATFQFGLGFELHQKKKPVPAVSDSAFAWGGMMGTGYIIDPERDLVALFYANMYNLEPLYPRFLAQAYRLSEPVGGANRGSEGPATGPSSPRNNNSYNVPPPSRPIVVLPALPEPEDKSFHAERNVPHGRVEVVQYKNSAGVDRPLHVYLPPGYDAETERRYPVLYLNHGGGENEGTWTAKGFAHHILDNLIAERKARPMIIVMPNTANLVSGTPPKLGEDDACTQEYLKQILPFVDARYRTRPERASRAVAGFSMGGFVALNTGLTHLETFGELYVFSSGYWPKELKLFKERSRPLLTDPTINERLRMPIYLATGETDIAYLNSMKTLAVFADHGVRTFSVLSSHGHEWLNCRRYLCQAAQIMFPEDR